MDKTTLTLALREYAKTLSKEDIKAWIQHLDKVGGCKAHREMRVELRAVLVNLTRVKR
jgi:hypothetical protein